MEAIRETGDSIRFLLVTVNFIEIFGVQEYGDEASWKER